MDVLSDGAGNVRVHLGGGARHLVGYIHVDLAEYDHIDFRHDLRTLPMFEDATVDLIYSSHTLEYFDRVEVIDVLAEWRRVLKPHGILRLAVPDFKALLKLYQATGDLERVLGPLYGRWPIPGTPVTIYHRTVYDEQSLSNLLRSSGFSQVRHWDWRVVFSGPYEGFDDYSQAYYPHLKKDDGLLISLNLEATRS